MKNKIILIKAILIGLIFNVNSQNWTEISNGVDGEISTMIEFNGKLVVGGDFNQVGGSLNAYNIATWNGVSWETMGNGFDNDVRSLVVFNNELYAGGLLRRNNSNTLDFEGNIAKWNGTDWEAVPGIGWTSEYSNSPISNMIVYNNKLHVVFERYITALSASRVVMATYDGSTWTDIWNNDFLTDSGSGIAVFSLGIYNSDLIIGGRFNGFQSTISPSFFKYNGTNFEAFTSPVSYGNTYTIKQIANKLYLGGLFTYDNGAEIYPNLISFDGTEWNAYPFDNNNGREIYNLAVKNDSIFVLGRFDFYDPANTSNTIMACAYFDPNLSYPFKNMHFFNTSSSSNTTINQGIIYMNELIVSGDFNYAGANSANNIAKLLPGLPILSINEMYHNDNVIFPNPFDNFLKLSNNFKNEKYQLLNSQGKLIQEGIYINEINTINLNYGIYFLKIKNNNYKIFK